MFAYRRRHPRGGTFLAITNGCQWKPLGDAGVVVAVAGLSAARRVLGSDGDRGVRDAGIELPGPAFVWLVGP